MPLEYVTSNAGHPMLLIDRYTFHRHSTNPKTGRTNWRCSRRRVKDIRCTSSCHSVNDTASMPSPHDPNCLPLTNAELVAYEIRREKLNNGKIFKSLDGSNFSQANDEEHQSNDCSFEKTYSNSYNLDNFQNREIGSDDEELNNVLNNLDENVISTKSPELIDNNNENNDFDNSEIDNNDNINNPNSYNNNDDKEEHSLDSIVQDFVEPTNTITDIIERNKRILNTINKKDSIQLKSQASNSILNKSIYFVTSKVGHPMLVVDQYTFHKHSTNPKTGRINWRCSRRRVKEIRCSSSCYTVDGVASNPSPHDPRCFPLTEALLKNYQNKRAKVPLNNFINTKVESYTTLKNKESLNQTDEFSCDDTEHDHNQTHDEYNEMNISENGYTHRPQLFVRNKRKENFPTRSKEENGNDLTISDIIEGQDVLRNANDDYYYETNIDYEDNKNEEFAYYDDENVPISDIENSQLNNHNTENDKNNFMNLNKESSDEALDIGNQYSTYDVNENLDENEYICSPADVNEYNVNTCSSPSTISKLINDLNEMKRKEKIYSNKLKNANGEIFRLKKVTSNQIQSLKWKSKMMEIDMSSLKSSIQQKNIENINLKKLVDDMMSNIKLNFK